MSAIVNSSQWSNTIDSIPSYSEPQIPVSRIPRHSLRTRVAYDTESRSTSSSGAYKELSQYDRGEYYNKLSPYGHVPRSSSSVSVEEQMDGGAADVLEALRSRRHYSQIQSRQLPYQSSQDSDYMGVHSTTSLPISQSTNYQRTYRTGGTYKPSSPTSSSDNASLASSIHHRLGSGPASEASFSSINLSQSTTCSGNNGYVYRLPRPSLSNSNPGSVANILPPRHYSLNSKSEPVHEKTQYYHHPMPKKGFQSPEQNDSSSSSKNPPMSEGKRRHKHGGNGKSERDSFSMKLEVVMSMMSALSTSSQSDSDAVKLLLALSQSSETCSVLRQSVCLNQLIKIIHNNESPPKDHVEVKAKGLEALRNIVESNSNSKIRHCERSVLRTLNKVRAHCDQVFDFIHNIDYEDIMTTGELDRIQKSCDEVTQSLRKLLKFSSEKQMYRPAILNLGGLQAMADILISDHGLPKKKIESIIGHSSETLAITITILINLTYGDINNKVILCKVPLFLDSLMSHFYSFNEQVMSKGAQVLRNLSCKATPEIKECLKNCHAVVVLMEAVDRACNETTVQHITSALWNVSAHSLDNRYKVCKTPRGIESLVGLLSYNSPSGATIVIENVGGVLRNLSNVISQEQEYRTRFREAGGLAKLVQHLKSRNKVVLANATGILWNMSARCLENQHFLWDLGCIPLLDVLQTSQQRNISENARGALRNLLAFGQSQGWTPPSVDLSIPSDVRKQQQLYSKSTMALTSGGHSSSENMRSGRSSAPFVSTRSAHNSSTSLRTSSQKNSASRSSVEKSSAYHIVPTHYKSGDELYTRKFSRVASAPQPNDEWMNYRPVALHDNSPELNPEYRHIVPTSQVHPSKKPAKIHTVKLSNGHSYSYSQSESCDSEFQSISGASLGASLGLSPQLPTDEGVMREVGNDISYDELDIELEDDHLDDEVASHYRNPSQAESETSDYLSIADQFVRDRESMRRSANSPGIQLACKLSPSLYQHKILTSELIRSLGTSGLALDGTTPSQDGLEPISEANDAIGTSRSDVSRSHSNSISSGGPEMGKDN